MALRIFSYVFKSLKNTVVLAFINGRKSCYLYKFSEISCDISVVKVALLAQRRECFQELRITIGFVDNRVIVLHMQLLTCVPKENKNIQRFFSTYPYLDHAFL